MAEIGSIIRKYTDGMWDDREGFDFLGMHHRRMTTETSKGQLYKETYQYPSRKAMKRMKEEIYFE